MSVKLTCCGDASMLHILTLHDRRIYLRRHPDRVIRELCAGFLEPAAVDDSSRRVDRNADSLSPFRSPRSIAACHRASQTMKLAHFLSKFKMRGANVEQ